MAGIAVDRALQEIEGARIALGVEREHAGHGPEGQLVRAEIDIGRAPGALDLGEAQAGLERGGDARREMLLGRRVVAERAVGAVGPEVIAGLGLDQPEGQAGLPSCSAQVPGQVIARRLRPAGHGNAGPGQRGGQLVGNEAGKLAMLGTHLDREEGDGRAVAAECQE
jgi:hypothetical protein